MNNSQYLLATMLAAGLCLPANSALSRERIIIGKLQIGYDYWERQYDSENSEPEIPTIKHKQYYGAPEFALQIRGPLDFFRLRYSPVLKYDETGETSDVDHLANLAAMFHLTRKWSIDLEDSFTRSDDPFKTVSTAQWAEEQDNPGIPDSETNPLDQNLEELTNEPGRNDYWHNSGIARTSYAYADGSRFLLGYGNRLLHNDDGEPGYREYDSHDYFGQWTHRYSHFWDTDITLHFLEGFFEENTSTTDQISREPEPSDDLVEYRGEGAITYHQDGHNSYSLNYGYFSSMYDSTFRQDIWVHSLTASWTHTFDEHSSLILGGGPSYLEGEEGDGTMDYNARAQLTRTLERVAYALFFEKGYRIRNFTGSENNGVIDRYLGGLTVSAQLTHHFLGKIFGIYQFTSSLDPQNEYYLAALADAPLATGEDINDITYDASRYRIGTGLNYVFSKNYETGIDYEFLKNDGDIERDSYEDHRVIVWVSAATDPFRW